MNPFTVFATFDMDQMVTILRTSEKRALSQRRILLKKKEGIAPQSRKIFQKFI